MEGLAWAVVVWMGLLGFFVSRIADNTRKTMENSRKQLEFLDFISRLLEDEFENITSVLEDEFDNGKKKNATDKGNSRN